MWKLAIAITLAVAVGVEGASKPKIPMNLTQIKMIMRNRSKPRFQEPLKIKFNAPCTNQRKPGVVSNCSWSYVADTFDTQQSINFHNGLRFKIFVGAEWHGLSGFQPIGFVEDLHASGELTGNATQMAISCIKNPDSCKKVPNGFNIYDTDAKELLPRVEWVDAFNHWYSGVTKYDYTTKFKSNPDTDSYTQLIWADTHSVGCTSLTYTQLKPKLPSRRIFVCAYDPPGNIEGQTVYQTRHFCMNCHIGCEMFADVCFQ